MKQLIGRTVDKIFLGHAENAAGETHQYIVFHTENGFYPFKILHQKIIAIKNVDMVLGQIVTNCGAFLAPEHGERIITDLGLMDIIYEGEYMDYAKNIDYMTDRVIPQELLDQNFIEINHDYPAN